MTDPGQERLQKVLAAANVGSRRYCDQLIAAGRVTVDGEVAAVGTQVDPTAVEVRVDGQRVNINPQLVYYMLNKPRGVVSTASDPQGRPTVMDLVDIDQRVFTVGRLDMDSEGLLLLTNDGDLTHALTHPSYAVERVYVAKVRGVLSKQAQSRLREGVVLEDGPARARSVRVLGRAGGRSLVELMLTEGRKREVRRMLGAVGSRVERLARVAYGGVELGELGQGSWRPLSWQEVARLYAAVDAGPAPRPGERIFSADGR